MKIEFFLNTGFSFAGATHKEIVEYPDDTPMEDVQDDFNTWVWQKIDAGWHEVKEHER